MQWVDNYRPLCYTCGVAKEIKTDVFRVYSNNKTICILSYGI